jgi:uncharacterized protein (DUF4213/DUF364 family)
LSIADRIAENLKHTCNGYYANDVRLGLRYVAVQLDNTACGVAYRFPSKKGCDEISIPGNGSLVGREAGELLSWIRSENSLLRSVGLATANAVIGSFKLKVTQGDIRSLIEFKPKESVAMVGYFEPLVPYISDRSALNIYEIETSLAPQLRRSSDALKGLQTCDVALITSTAIINDTLDDLLEAASGCREVVILGPSTPMLPEIFEGTPVTLLSGIKVQDNQTLLRTVSEGGGMQSFKSCVQKVNYQLIRNYSS